MEVSPVAKKLPVTYRLVTLNDEEMYEITNPNMLVCNLDEHNRLTGGAPYTRTIPRHQGDNTVYMPTRGKCFHLSIDCPSCLDVQGVTTHIEALVKGYICCTRCRSYR